jgi:hypothetical protein
MHPTYRVRYSVVFNGRPRSPADVQAVDVESDLAGVPERLPAGAYILSIEDMAADRPVHWTRWPTAYRPGFGGEPASRPAPDVPRLFEPYLPPAESLPEPFVPVLDRAPR